MNKLDNIVIFLIFLFLISFTFSAVAVPASKPSIPASTVTDKEGFAGEPWQQKWNKVLAEARKEGSAVVYGNFSQGERMAVSKGIKARYGIEMEWVLGSSSQMVAKVVAERGAGLYIADVNAQGALGSLLVKEKGFLQKLDDAVVLPEVGDPNVWFGKKFPWFDRDHTNISFVGEVSPDVIVNSNLVKEGEITGFRDLLNPKWRGKIVMYDPTIAGTMLAWFTIMGPSLGGETYMRALAKQEPAILTDRRLAVEWVARGKVSIGMSMRPAVIYSFIKGGSPIRIITNAKEGGYLSNSHGTISLYNKAPHPNAAIVFLNYLLSKEGQTAYSQGGGSMVKRLDVPTDHLNPSVIPVPGKTYLEQSEDFAREMKKNQELTKKIFAPLFK